MSEATETESNTELNKVSAMMVDVSGLDVDQAVHKIIDHAVAINASDLFISSNEDYVSAQARALGIVQQLCIVSREEGMRFLSHIKALAGMDVGERRRPLDGRWMRLTEEGQVVDLRINMIPTMYGEDFAIRLLSRDTDLYQIENLGLTKDQYNHLCNMLESPAGMILCTGPTGSGKTATLYACLQRLNDGRKKINTIEDPVEFSVEGLRQSQINLKIGVGFSELLRAVLRQAPDIIMVGEIRDAETADIAVRAANSGHLVFSTLHAAVAASAVQSMSSLGVHPHFLSSALRGVISQRLARTLCNECKVSFDMSAAPHTFDDVKQWLAPGEGSTLYAPKGCEACNMQGYGGRTGVYEIMPITPGVRALIADGRPTRDIRSKALEEGMMEFRQAALLKVARGETSTEEVFRVIPAEHLLHDE